MLFTGLSIKIRYFFYAWGPIIKYIRDMLFDFLKKSGCEANLARLMGEVIPDAIKKVKQAIKGQGSEKSGTINPSGEAQLALDVRANDIIVEILKKSELVWWLASEEMQDPEEVGNENAPFTVVFDPLDGSSLVDVNFAVGSIFGVYSWPVDHAKRWEKMQMPRTGAEQVAACFAVYGPHTTIVLTVKKGTHEFRLADDGNFYLSKENLKVAPQAKHFAPGNLRAAAEREDYLKLTNEWIKNGLTLRYSGGMVPDLNHIFLKGNGIFTYPGYSKAPEGKLRLLFECNPMALLMEQAGGAATDGSQRILSKKITELHQRTPIYIGSKKMVASIGKMLS